MDFLRRIYFNEVYDYKDVTATKTTNFIEAIRLSNVINALYAIRKIILAMDAIAPF